MTIGWPLAALACLAIGLLCGYLIGRDRAADDETAARFDAVPAPGRHRVAVPRQLPAAPKSAHRGHVRPPRSRGGRAHGRHAAAARRAGRPRAATPPGAVTDAIRRWEADTDRFIAQMGAGR